MKVSSFGEDEQQRLLVLHRLPPVSFYLVTVRDDCEVRGEEEGRRGMKLNGRGEKVSLAWFLDRL